MAANSDAAAAAAVAADAVMSADTAYWIVLAAGLAGLIGMILTDTKKTWLAGGMFVAWTAVYMSQPPDAAGAAVGAAIRTTAELLIFLIPIMTVIEGGVHYGMMNAILRLINTTSKRSLMVIVGIMSFVLSAVLDNLTAAVVMGVLVTQLMKSTENRVIFACLIVAAANAGGVPSAIGNTTSIMLWVGHQLNLETMFLGLILPSIAYMAVIFVCFSFMLSGNVERPVPDELDVEALEQDQSFDLPHWQQWMILGLVLLCISIVIGMKIVFSVPPYVGAAGAFFLWGLLTWRLNTARGAHFLAERDVRSALKHIDHATVVIFLFMLPLVAAVGHAGILDDLSRLLIAAVDATLGEGARDWGVTVSMGLLSSAIPNTPLVAASQVMFDHPTDHRFWLLLNYTTGVGGSLLPFGSAAGVVLASRFRGSLTLGRYVSVVTLPALLAFFVGLAVIWVQMEVF